MKINRYSKGQILEYHFPKRAVKKVESSSVIQNSHRVVVLHSRQTPYNTVLIAPITKAIALKGKNTIPSNYVKLSKNDYSGMLTDDCYINLDMCVVVDTEEVDKLSRYNKKIDASLNAIDLGELDYKLILTYELSGYIKQELDKELANEFKVVIELIDSDIKQRIASLLDQIKDESIKTEVIGIINELVNELNDTFIKN